MNRALALVAALVISLAALAQTPYLVKDIRTVPTDESSSDPIDFVGDGDKIYFTASDYRGAELWKIEGGTASLVKDLEPSGSSAPSWVEPIGGGISLFSARTHAQGRELWRTDGTSDGTTLVKDINPSGDGDVFVRGFFGGLVYLIAATPENGSEVWVTDGTAAGTRLLKDLNGTSASSNPKVLGTFGDSVAIVGAGGLWLTDGTEQGTTLVKGGISARGGKVVGDKIYFGGSDPENGEELWVSDGTENGTHRLFVLNPSSTESSLSYFSRVIVVPVGDRLLFFGNDGSAERRGLWSTDGTLEGTHFVMRIYETPEVVNGVAYFFEYRASLWRTDGTRAGTYRLDSGAAGHPVAAFDTAWFVSEDGAGNRFWRATDGTIAGTSTIATQASGSGFANAAFINGKVYFAYDDRTLHGTEPWAFDGTQSSMIANIGAELGSGAPDSLFAVGDRVFFTATDDSGDRDLWRSDGTGDGTLRLNALLATAPYVTPYVTPFTEFLGSFVFRQNSELWKSDGTANAAIRIRSWPRIDGAVAVANRLYVGTGNNVWVTDGTEAGTTVVNAEPAPADAAGSCSTPVELAGRAYFTCGYPVRWLWRADGNTARAILSVTTSALMSAGGALYFAQSADGVNRLWRSDGTAEGTKAVAPASPVLGAKFVGVAPRVYFPAWDSATGIELWRTEGTQESTVRVADIRTGTESSSPSSLVAVGDSLFFTADDGAHGAEIWRTDGTEEGTRLVKDIAPGAASSSPASLVAADGALWFAANDGVHGLELWRSDGTEAGTTMVADLVPGAASSSPAQLAGSSRHLFFKAWQPASGYELWAISLTAGRISVSDVRVAEEAASVQFVVTRSGDLTSPATVSYATRDGVALAGSDYVAASGTLSFDAGVATRTITVPLLSDTQLEADENFFVILSSPTNVSLLRTAATALIEDDDRRAELSVEIVHPNGAVSRWVRITNAGPSTASQVRLRMTYSPGERACEGCWTSLEPFAPGESRDVFLDPGNPQLVSTRMVGYVLAATVSAAEQDSNPADNTASRLMDFSGRLVVPLQLLTNTTGSGIYTDSLSTTVSVTSSSPIITVSPSRWSAPAPPILATFNLSAGSTKGTATITASAAYGASLDVAVVGPGEQARLSTLLTTELVGPKAGDPLPIPVTVRGLRHADGARPAGVVTLRDAQGAVLQQAALDSNSSVTFSRTLPVGTYMHKVDYSGDPNFLPSSGTIYSSVRAKYTSSQILISRTSCMVAEGAVIINAEAGPEPPAGTVKIWLNSVSIGTFPVQPSGTPGQSRAVIRLNLAGGTNRIRADFTGTPEFEYSMNYASVAAFDCAGLATALYTITPCRLFDSRNSVSLNAGGQRDVHVTGRCGIPSTAKAIAANVTTVSPAANGYLRLLPAGVLPRPNTSTVSYRAGRTRATNSILSLNADGIVETFNGGSAGVHFIIDVFGYFQ